MLTGAAQPAFSQRRLIDSLKTTLVRKLPDTTRANTYYDIANAFYKQNQLDSVDHYLKQTKQLSQRISYYGGLGDYNRLRGAICMRQGLFEEALTFDQAAIQYYAKVNKQKSIGQVYNNLGWLYKTMGESQHVLAYTRQGIAHMQQAIAINQRLNASLQLVDNYVNLGILYEDLGEFKQGRDCFFKALAINERIHAKPEENRIMYNNLGKNYNVEKQYDQAIVYLNKSLAINLALKKNSSLAHNYRNLATSYLGLNQPKRALEYAEKALEQVQISKDIPLQTSVYRVLSRSYAAAGQYDKAYKAVLEDKQIEDSLMNLEKTRAIAQLQGKFQVQQANALAKIKADLELAKTREIANIEAEKAKEIAGVQAEENRRIAQIKARSEVEKTRAVAEIQTKYNTQKRLHQIAILDKENQQHTQQIQQMASGLGLLFVLVSILIGQYYVIRRANRRLSEQNDIITRNSRQLVNQSDQLRTLMKELHHRVKNNLAIVSSLLNLQMSGMNDEKAIQAVRVGQQRVEAMSLIHQQLYRTDQLTEIDMQEYLTNLAESLMRAYGYQADDFRLLIDIERQKLDVEIAIPIGLIVNELITNAFKYAYIDHHDPLLRIGLRTDSNPFLSGLTLEVQDNGPGIEVSDWRKAGKLTSFGKLLITSLSEQLEGHYELHSDNGTLFRLHIPHTRLAA
ncbi:hypothetical protein GCM10028773_45770 [Spirosoma koreense]